MTLALSLVDSERTLPRGAFNARQTWATRSACIVTLLSDEGGRGFGEASPLPGFSPDTLEECRLALTAFDTTTLPSRLEPGQAVLPELSRASSRLPERVPAARAALEGALLDLWARAASKPAWALLVDPGAETPSPRTLAALLMGGPEQAVDEALQARARGLETFKFKVGRPGALEQELAAVRRLRAQLGDGVRIRLDANRSFDAEQARTWLPRFAAHGLEYVEEPCALGELSELAEREVPLALDESLAELDPRAVAHGQSNTRGVRALILKPTLLGGISACCAWADAARRIGARVILSHAFEGPLGLALSAALALSIGSESSAHGLDPQGAGLEQLNLPYFRDSRLHGWLEPGLAAWSEAS